MQHCQHVAVPPRTARFQDRQRLLLVLDGAGWHKAGTLPLLERLRLLLLPLYTPECSLTNHIWDEVHEKGFANRFFAPPLTRWKLV